MRRVSITFLNNFFNPLYFTNSIPFFFFGGGGGGNDWGCCSTAAPMGDPPLTLGSQRPRLYGLPKTHKKDVPLRPKLSMIGSAQHELASSNLSWTYIRLLASSTPSLSLMKFNSLTLTLRTPSCALLTSRAFFELQQLL